MRESVNSPESDDAALETERRLGLDIMDIFERVAKLADAKPVLGERALDFIDEMVAHVRDALALRKAN